MNDPTHPVAAGPRDTETEVMLHAHRRLAVTTLALLIGRDPDPEALLRRIEDAFAFRDHHEDPGSDPDPAFAIEAAADREMRRMLGEVRSLIGRGGG